MSKLQLKEIITISGNKALRGNCKKYKDGYYEKNIDCFYVESEKRWYKDKNVLIQDEQSLIWYKKNKEEFNFINVFLEISHDTFQKTPVFISVHKNNYVYKNIISLSNSLRIFYKDKLIYVPKNQEFEIINYIAEGELFYNNISNGIVFEKIENLNVTRPNSLNYTSDESLSEYIEYNNNFIENNKTAINRYFNFKFSNNLPVVLEKTLDNYKVGIEIETITGELPISICKLLGFIPLRDGSLRNDNGSQGLEYATIPLQTKEQFLCFMLGLKIIQNLCTFNIKCSTHVHISGLELNKNNLVAVYKTLFDTQNELYEFFPNYKKVNDGTKRLHYTAPLPKLISLFSNSVDVDKSANNIVDYLSQGTEVIYREEMNMISDNTSKWNISTRYHIWNFISWVFSKRGTLENRLHTPTFNENKIIAWILFNVEFLKFIEKNTNVILENKIELKLKDIISTFKNKNVIIDYFKHRHDLKKTSDALGKIEFYEDDAFKIKNIKKTNDLLTDIRLDRENAFDFFQTMERLFYVDPNTNPSPPTPVLGITNNF